MSRNLIVGIQARSGSTRLARKSLQEIGGKSLVQHCYEACRNEDRDAIVLIHRKDELMEEHCIIHGMLYRKCDCEENDVLSRYVDTMRVLDPYTHIARITADCPFVWPFAFREIDFWSNAHPTLRTVPDGWDFEVMNRRFLGWLDEVSTREEREHVTAAAYRINPSGFNIQFARFKFDMFNGWPKISVDTQEDLDRMRAMYVGS